jgi:hypothetical protein
VEDLHKPWWARSSFATSILGTLGVLLAARRLGWDGVPDELILTVAGNWLIWIGYLRWAPSDKPPEAR